MEQYRLRPSDFRMEIYTPGKPVRTGVYAFLEMHNTGVDAGEVYGQSFNNSTRQNASTQLRNMAALSLNGADAGHNPSLKQFQKLLEGPTSSVVLDLDGVLVTPPLDGILRSITIEELVNGAPAAGLEVRIQELHRDDLGRCRGAWLLSSGRILARVTHVDGQELPSSPLDVRLSRLLGVPWR